MTTEERTPSATLKRYLYYAVTSAPLVIHHRGDDVTDDMKVLPINDNFTSEDMVQIHKVIVAMYRYLKYCVERVVLFEVVK